MTYISTRGSAPVLGFGEAMMTGLARDGGLYVPQTVPVMAQADVAALAGLPYEEVAFRIMRPYLGGFFADDEFRGLIAKAYAGFHHDARAPMVQLASNHFLLELFHGPTLAF
ncbi:MAG TPA: threonine synthase, partial [Tabrizicola sp.]|nr:threonine synthase [Tabrizicola sp.]